MSYKIVVKQHPKIILTDTLSSAFIQLEKLPSLLLYCARVINVECFENENIANSFLSGACHANFKSVINTQIVKKL